MHGCHLEVHYRSEKYSPLYSGHSLLRLSHINQLKKSISLLVNELIDQRRELYGETVAFSIPCLFLPFDSKSLRMSCCWKFSDVFFLHFSFFKR